jgi:hypothetical protein
MSDPKKDPSTNNPDHIEHSEKVIRGSGARLVDQNVPEDFIASSMALDTPDDHPDK